MNCYEFCTRDFDDAKQIYIAIDTDLIGTHIMTNIICFTNILFIKNRQNIDMKNYSSVALQ